MCVWGISIHASAKETTHLGYAIGFSYKFQSTPPRRRRHIPAKTVIATPVISIHASAKEATTDQAALGRALAISIHASAKEATNVPLFAPVSSRISIHASAKEATSSARAEQSRQRRFQSTPPRRRRPQHIVIPQLSCAYLVVTTFLSAIFSFISQYVVLFFLF